MNGQHRFETPENVQVDYAAAGLGTRFIAWFVDQVLLTILLIGALIALVFVGASFDQLDALDPDTGDADPDLILFYMIGIWSILWGIGSFLYFSACELLLRGQTIGKRMSDIRVVKSNGFQLDAASILVRNAFRVVDQLPPMWIVPLLSKRSQRAGDMVASTLVVNAGTSELSSVRSVLTEQRASDAVFRFDHSTLKRLSPSDYDSVERFLERRAQLELGEQIDLLHAFTDRLAQKLGIEVPLPSQQAKFLEDLLAAELRRRDRHLA